MHPQWDFYWSGGTWWSFWTSACSRGEGLTNQSAGMQAQWESSGVLTDRDNAGDCIAGIDGVLPNQDQTANCLTQTRPQLVT